MYKILYFTDTHFSYQRPKYRIDDFLETQINKLQQIQQIIKDEKIELVIFGGDMFHSYQPHNVILGEVLHEFLKFDRLIFAIMGNHDLIGYNHNALPETGLGVMCKAGAAQLIKQETKFIPKNNPELTMFAIHYRKQQDLSTYDLKLEKDKVYGTKIIVSHDMITPTTQKYESILIKDVAETTNADIILCSHYHGSFLEKVNKTWFINPGALVRRKITDADHKPQVTIIEIDKKIKIDFIPLVTKKNNEIFNIEAMDKIKAKKVNLEDFITLLKETRIKDTDIDKHIDRLGEKLKISKDIISLAKERVQKARITLGSD